MKVQYLPGLVDLLGERQGLLAFQSRQYASIAS